MNNTHIRKNIVWGGAVALIIGITGTANAQPVDPLEPQPCRAPSCQAKAARQPAPMPVNQGDAPAAPRYQQPPVVDPSVFGYGADPNAGRVGMTPADRVRMQIATPHHVRVARYYAQRGMAYMPFPQQYGYGGGYNNRRGNYNSRFMSPAYVAREMRRLEREESVAAPMLKGGSGFLDNVHVYVNGCMKGRGDDFNNPRLGDQPFPIMPYVVNEIVLVTRKDGKKDGEIDARVMYVTPEDMATYETTSNGERKFFSLPGSKGDFQMLPPFDFAKLSAPGSCTAPSGN